MEVRVESADGFNMPPGCYVGVRVGDVLKQGRYEPSRCYHFPSIERRRNAKIDIYRHVGSSIIAVDPDAKSIHEIQVSTSDPTVPQMKLKVNVQSSNVDAGKVREERSNAVKSQAKDYLSKYNIEEKLSDAVKALLKEQPADPTAFLCRHLLGGGSLPASPVAQNQATQAIRAAPVAASSGKPTGPAVSKPFNTYYQDNCLPGSSPSCMNDIYSKFPAAAKREQPKAASGVDIKALRDQARDVLLKGSENGGLAEALKESGAARQPPKAEGPDLVALRNQAREILVTASENNSLAQALREVRTAETDKLKKFQSTPSVGTWLAYRPPQPQEPEEVKVFSKLPSVGTWLAAPSPMEPEPPGGFAVPANLMMGPQVYSLGVSVNTMRFI